GQVIFLLQERLMLVLAVNVNKKAGSSAKSSHRHRLPVYFIDAPAIYQLPRYNDLAVLPRDVQLLRNFPSDLLPGGKQKLHQGVIRAFLGKPFKALGTQ